MHDFPLYHDEFARMPWREMPWLAFDFETTGADPRTARPIQIGQAGRLPDQPQARIGAAWIHTDESLDDVRDVLKFTLEEEAGIRDARPFPEVCEGFLYILRIAPFVCAFNGGPAIDPDGTGYDGPLLAHECQRHGLEVPKRPLIDVMVLAMHYLRPAPPKWNLSVIAAHLGIEPPGQFHRADADCWVTLRVLERLAECPDLPETLGELQALVDRLAPYSWWLTETPDGLALNCGKYRGWTLRKVIGIRDYHGNPGAYLRWALDLPDLPPAVAVHFRAALEGK